MLTSLRFAGGRCSWSSLPLSGEMAGTTDPCAFHVTVLTKQELPAGGYVLSATHNSVLAHVASPVRFLSMKEGDWYICSACFYDQDFKLFDSRDIIKEVEDTGQKFTEKLE